MKRHNGTHFLDIKGKIEDAKEILSGYEEEIRDAEKAGDKDKAKRYEELAQKQENYIEGLEERAKDF